MRKVVSVIMVFVLGVTLFTGIGKQSNATTITNRCVIPIKAGAVFAMCYNVGKSAKEKKKLIDCNLVYDKILEMVIRPVDLEFYIMSKNVSAGRTACTRACMKGNSGISPRVIEEDIRYMLNKERCPFPNKLKDLIYNRR